MSFQKNNTPNEQQITKSTGGIVNIIANYIPMLSLLFEQMTGQSIPQAKGTLADILNCLQRLETKIDNLERNCDQQFTLQEQQLNSIQQVTKLVSTEKTKAIHFGKQNLITEE